MGCGLSKYFSCFDRQTQATIDNHPLVATKAPVLIRAVDRAATPVASTYQSAESNADKGNDTDFIVLRNRCGRFRILVIGKANAGKTTILQKMCNTTEAPVIHNQDGEEIHQSVIQPTDGRGIHDIENELTFSSNEAFVFHDSRGFEAGSVTELENVREFIAKRAARPELKDQLHAIWYCIPTDNDRPLSSAEISFFEKGTGRTPVIAIFTKYDGMTLKEYNKLRFEKGFTKKTATELAPKYAEELFLNSDYYLKRVLGAPHPPIRWLKVQDLHKPENTCADLSRQTLEALDNKILQQLFLSVQRNNIELGTEWAIKNHVPYGLRQATDEDSFSDIAEKLLKNMLRCYGHLYVNKDYGEAHDLHTYAGIGVDDDGIGGFDEYDEAMLLAFRLAFPALIGQGIVFLRILRLATAFLVVAEDSFWLTKDGRTKVEGFKLALANFQESGKASVMIQEVDEMFRHVGLENMVPDEEGKGEGFKRMLEMVRKLKVQM